LGPVDEKVVHRTVVPHRESLRYLEFKNVVNDGRQMIRSVSMGGCCRTQFGESRWSNVDDSDVAVPPVEQGECDRRRTTTYIDHRALGP
jgi:hypothetical protein